MFLNPTVEQARAQEREERRFWAVNSDDWSVQQVSGFDCRPNSETSWWVPELGYTMTEGYHLFGTKAEAVAEARSEISQKIAELQKALAALN